MQYFTASIKKAIKFIDGYNVTGTKIIFQGFTHQILDE